MSADLTRRAVPGALRLPDQPELAVVVLLDHRSDDPEGVRVVPVLDDEALATLVLSRTLLTAGLTSGAGADDAVQVQVIGEQVVLGIGTLELALAVQDLSEMLLATYAASPTGSTPPRVVSLDAPRVSSAT